MRVKEKKTVSDPPRKKRHLLDDLLSAMFLVNRNLTYCNNPNVLFLSFLKFRFVTKGGIACLCCIFTEEVRI